MKLTTSQRASLASRPSPHGPRRRGTVAVLVAMSLVPLMAIVAVAVDSGVLFSEKRHAQAVADAAAMAAATVLYDTYPKNQGKDTSGAASSAALASAAANGYANDGTKSIVEVNIPPLSGPYAGKDSYAEVIVTWKQVRFFSKVFGSDPVAVKARAVGRGAWTAPNAGIIVLAYEGKGTLNTQGNGALTAVGGPVIVNSNNPTAAISGGNGTMQAPEFIITGGYTLSGGGAFIGPITTGAHPTPDPLAYLPEPDPPGAGSVKKTSIGAGKFQYDIYPGMHSNLPNFGSGDVVILHQASSGNQGIFYLAEGGLNSQGATIQMAAGESGGAMLYNAGTGTNDKIKITGNPSGTVNITPLTDGPYSGLSLFQNRDGSQAMEIEGNGNFTIKGTLYTAGGLLSVAGNGAVSNVGSQYVSKDLAISGNGNVSIDYQGPGVARTRLILLVE